MMRPSKLKLIFILSLILLAAVFIATIYLIPSKLDFAESKNIQIIEGEKEWILEYDIFNNEERDITYEIQVMVNGNAFNDNTTVASGREYTYILNIPHKKITNGDVTFTVFEEGMQEPIEQAIFKLQTD